MTTKPNTGQPANDNADKLCVRFSWQENPPLSVEEVAIFDALISTFDMLTAANDNELKDKKEE